MNHLNQIFRYESKVLTAILIKGQPYFIAKEVCYILEHSDSRKAVSRLDEDEKLLGKLFLSGQNRETWLINESGLYSLILTSRKPEAKAFKRWITHEVLPSLRHTGSYSIHNTQPKLPMSYKEALLELLSKVEENEQLQLLTEKQEQILIEQQPKVEMYNTFLSTDGLQNMTQVAKSIGWGRNSLYSFLRSEGVLIDSTSPYKRNTPYQQYINKGYFKVINVTVKSPTGLGLSQQTLVTPKGVEFIVKLLRSKHKEISYSKGVKETVKAGVYNEFPC